MAGEKVLIVDDDPAIRKMITRVLTGNGLTPIQADSGEEALKALGEDAALRLVLLDITMGGIDGFETLRILRSQGNNVPVMIISGNSEDYDVLYGLEIGGDDYITKPFNPVVLGAKVKALIRRDQKAGNTSVLHFGPFSYQMETMRLYKDEEEIFLSGKESRMLRLFLENNNRVFTKEQLYETVWGDEIVDENAIMVYISRLRNKLEDNPKKPAYLKTVWGVGYKFSMD